MGTIRKIGDDYFIEFIARGLKYQRNGGKDKASAQRLLQEIEDKIQKGEESIVVHQLTADQFFSDFLALIKEEYDPRTFSRYQSAVKHFKKFVHSTLFSDCKVSEITPKVVEEYCAVLLKELGENKAKIYNFTLLLIRDMFDHAINFGHINDNPTLHARLIEIPAEKIPKTFNDEEIQELLSGSSAEIKHLMELILGTGMGFKELLSLKWTDIDFKNNCFKIESSSDPLRVGRTIPMDHEVIEIVRRLDIQNNSRQECVIADGAGEFSDYHVLHNTFAKNVLQKGVSLIGLFKLMGFRDIARIMKYSVFMKER